MAEQPPPREAIEAYVQWQIGKGKDVRYPSRLVEHIATNRDKWFEVYSWMAQARWGQQPEAAPAPDAAGDFWTEERREQWRAACQHMAICETFDPADFQNAGELLEHLPDHMAICSAGKTP